MKTNSAKPDVRTRTSVRTNRARTLRCCFAAVRIFPPPPQRQQRHHHRQHIGTTRRPHETYGALHTHKHTLTYTQSHTFRTVCVCMCKSECTQSTYKTYIAWVNHRQTQTHTSAAQPQRAARAHAPPPSLALPSHTWCRKRTGESLDK